MAITDLVGMWWKEGAKGDYLSSAKLSRTELIAAIEKAVGPEEFVVFAVFSRTKKKETAPDKQLCMMTFTPAGDQQQPERQPQPQRNPEPKSDYYPPPPEDDIPF